MGSCITARAIYAHSALIANTDIPDRIICKDTFVFITWTETAMTLSCAKYWHNDRKAPVSSGGGEGSHQRLIPDE